MLERTLACFALVAALAVAVAVAAPSLAQPSPSDERAAAERRAIQERERAREAAEERRESQERQRELAREAAENRAELQRELARAREQLAATAAEIARLSAQLTQPVLRDVMSNVRYIAGGRAMLGLNIEDTDLGVLVTGVTPSGPAAAAGVTVGDTIVAINDADLARTNERSPSAALYAEVEQVVAGDQVKLRVLRGGDYRDVLVEAAENQFWRTLSFEGGRVSWPTDWAPFRQSHAWSDLELVSLTPALGEYFGVERGLLVVRAGRAAELGFRDGDVILDLSGREPQSPEHALRIMASFEPGEAMPASIMRERRRETLTIRVPAAAEPQW